MPSRLTDPFPSRKQSDDIERLFTETGEGGDLAIDSDAAVATLAPGTEVIVVMKDGAVADGPLEKLATGHEAERGRNVQLTAELEAAKAKSHDLARALEAHPGVSLWAGRLS